MARLKLLEMDIDNKMIYFRKDDKIVAFDADVAIELIADVLDDKRPIVVRCKDCKECEERHTANYLPFLYCKLHEHSVSHNAFCCWAERREDAEHKEER